MDIPRTSTTAQDVDANKHGPRKCPAYAKESKRKGHFAEQCRSKKNAGSLSKGPSKEQQKTGPKKKFHEATADSESSEADFPEYDTQGSKLTGVLLPGACKICLGQLKSLG